MTVTRAGPRLSRFIGYQALDSLFLMMIPIGKIMLGNLAPNTPISYLYPFHFLI